MLEVADVGRLALPLSDEQAAAVRAVAEQTPYGKGSATLADTAVRRSWQLEPAQVVVANSDEWARKLARGVRLAAEGLGLPPQNVQVGRGRVSGCCLPGCCQAATALPPPHPFPGVTSAAQTAYAIAHLCQQPHGDSRPWV